MAIKIRRGLEADRTSVIFEEGEVLYTTDTKSFFIGDGVTAGGNQIGGTTSASLLKTEVHNATGATLTAGQVVYLSGNTGNKPNAVLAKADSEATSSKTIGLIILNIANNANGDIATDGLLSDIDTSAFAPGDLLWLSDSVAGGVTTIVPDTPNHAVFIGYIVAAHPTQGKILIHIQNGYELNELHDVKIASVADGDVLSYDSTLGYWKNAASSSFTPPNGLLKIASAISTTFQAVTDYLGNASVLFLNSRRIGIGKDTSVTTQSVAVVEVQDTNTSIVLKPNGTGAIIASVPDGTATGGNARGQYAVDLQMSRTASDQVATGNYSILLGNNSYASGNYSIAIGSGAYSQRDYSISLGRGQGTGARAVAIGYSAIASGTDCISIGGGSTWSNNSTGTGCVVIGGNQNSASANFSSIYGGTTNTASSSYSTISGGQSNTASTNTHATVVGGQSNTSSGNASTSGGFTNTASGQYSVTLGNNNIANGNSCISIGSSNTAQNDSSVSIGKSNVGSNNRTYAFGSSNTIPCGDSTCIGNSNNTTGGTNNLYAFGNGNILNTGTNSFAIGYQNTVSTSNGIALGFSGNVNAPYATSMGQWSRAYLYGQVSMANGLLGGSQNAQQSLLTAYNSTSLTTASTSVLSLDGTGTTNLIIPYGNNRAWNVQIDTIAVVTAITGTATGVSVGDVYSEVKNLLFKRIGGTSSIVGTVDTTAIKSDTSMSTAALTVTAGASQQMALTFTAPTFAGGGSVTCRVVSKVSLVEVAY